MTGSNRVVEPEAGRIIMTDSASRDTTAFNGASSASSWLWLVLLLFCMESALFLAFATDQFGLLDYLGLHLGLCATTAAFGSWRARATANNMAGTMTAILQLVMWTALAGPFGTFIAVALFVPRNGAASADTHSQPNVTDKPQAALNRLEILHHSLLDRRLRLDHAHPIRPLLDVFIDGTQIEKFDALSLISKRYVPAAAPALRSALEDRDGAVRVLAATVMAQQHNAHTKRIGDRQVLAKAAPDAPSAWSELAQAHLDYAQSGLLEASRAETELGYARTYRARVEERSGREERVATRDL